MPSDDTGSAKWKQGVFSVSPAVVLAVVLAWAVTIAGASWKAYGLGQDNVRAEESRAEKLVYEARELAQQGAAESIAKLAPVNQTIVQRVRREVETNTVYRECKHTPDGLRGVNAALTGQPAEPTGSGKLSGPDAAAK